MNKLHKGKNNLFDIKVITAYLVIASILILLLHLLQYLFQNNYRFSLLEIFKDLALIVLTSAIFYFVIASYLRKIFEVQAEYEKSQEKLRGVVEFSTNLFYTHDTDHVLTYMSPQIEKFFDCAPEEALIHWTEFATDNPINQLGYDSTQRAIDTGIAQSPFELELVGKKGRKIWVQVNEAPVIKNGKTVAIVGALTDITERKKAEDELRESEYVLSEAQRISKFSSWKFDLKKNEITWQAQTYQIYGVSSNDFVPTVESLIGLIHLEDRLAMENWIKQSSTHKKLPPVEIRIIRPSDNQLRYLVEQGQTFFDSEGKPDYVIGVVQDVTDVKIAQMKIRESEERYRTLAEAAQDMIFIIGRNGLVTYVNDFAAQLFGSRPEDIIGKSPELLFPNYTGKQRLNLQKVFEKNKPTYEESEIEFKLGEKIWVGTRIVPITNDAGQVKEILGIARNITEQKKTEDNLYIEKEYSDEIINSLPGIFYMFDKQGNFIRWNKNFEDVTGFSTKEISKKEPTDFFAGSDKQLIANKIKEAFTEGKTAVEANIETKDGKQIPYFFSAVRFIQNGELYLIGEGVDIAERKRAVEALKESEEKYHELIDTANDAIIVADISDGTIIDVNSAAEKLIGKPENEIIGMNQTELHPKEEGERYKKVFMDYIQSGKGIAGDLYVVRSDGTRVPVEISASVTEIRGKKIIQGIFRDITERKLVEKALKKRDLDIRRAYVDVFSAVTGGRLIIMTNDEIDSSLGKSLTEINHVSSENELSPARSMIKESITPYLPEDRLDDVITAASEALTNAIKHAGNGDFQTFKTNKTVQILVADKGPGIDFSVLPKATLLTGFSTKQSLGMGFSFMLEFCDRVLLSTQPGNTTIVLEINAEKGLKDEG